MWVMYFFISYLILALLIPLVWSVGRVYARMHNPREVRCPSGNRLAGIAPDVRYAIKTHLLADCALRVHSCSLWPERRGCRQECVGPAGSAV